ncbi:hypothetical protein LTR37_019607 [Vermiconidia calcicola]|uniref:Uncharacterized protein n=1 Tax=Vermiconidia calcicola TaxID=1690605 RepID=A0ACC3MEX4_9PEZI|nr:hypothetical protein LTR37_019607 [Vermiconidia calcicola]
MASPNQVSSLSMAGSNYAFCGANMCAWRVPEGFKKNLGDEDRSQYIVLGTQESWYRSFSRNGKQYLDRSGNFATEYPSLQKWLEEKKQFSKPKFLSLGPKGQYFAHTEWGRFWSLSEDIIKSLGNAHDYDRVWLGKDGSFVAAKKSKSGGMSKLGYRSKLGNRYPELEAKIKERGNPSVLALNLDNDQEYVAAWSNGAYIWKTKSGDKGNMQKFLQNHGMTKK